MVHKQNVRFRLVLFVCAFTVLFLSHGAFAAEKKTLSWGCVPTTSGLFPFYVVTARIWNEKIPEINVTVRATGAGVHNTRLLEKGEVDIGAMTTKTVWDATQGKGAFEGKPFTDLRLMYVCMTNPFQFVVSEKSGIKDLYGLEGKIFCPGILGSGTEQVSMEIFKLFGIRPKIRHMGYADAVEAMKNETIVGLAKTSVPDSSILDIASAMKIRIFSLTDSEVEKIVKNIAGLRKVVVPAGMYPGVGEFKTFEDEVCDVVRTGFPAELVYKMLKYMWENRVEIQKMSPKSAVVDRFPTVTIGVATPQIYLHPEAVKFYRELGLAVPKNLIPPEMGEK